MMLKNTPTNSLKDLWIIGSYFVVIWIILLMILSLFISQVFKVRVVGHRKM